MSFIFHLAQLRHAYRHLAAGTVKDQKGLADGLIAPAIRELERSLQATPEQAKAMLDELSDEDRLRSWAITARRADHQILAVSVGTTSRSTII